MASVFYVISWDIVYERFFPDYLTKYAEHVIEKARDAA